MVTPQSPHNEWLKSGVDPQIFALNVRVLTEDAPYAYLLYEIDTASGRVHPDAQWLWARKKYSHIECFDHDTKRQTIQNVNREIDKLGQCFNAAKCQVKVISLPGPEKGVDDFVVARERGRGAEEQGGRGENTINSYPSSPSGDEDAFTDLPSARNFTFQSNQRDIPSGDEDAFTDLPSARNFTFQSNQRDIPSGDRDGT